MTGDRPDEGALFAPLPDGRGVTELARIADGREILEQLHWPSRRPKDIATHLLGLSLDPAEGVALLHFAGWPAPVVEACPSASAARGPTDSHDAAPDRRDRVRPGRRHRLHRGRAPAR